MAQRVEAKDSLDDFPTPPWATRALLGHVIGPGEPIASQSAWEPACGRGHMSKVLWEKFKDVRSSDVHPYGYGTVEDYLSPSVVAPIDWVITNPPFKLAEEFALKGIATARRGVALLVRTVFIESVGRYERLFKPHPPAFVAQFTERVPMVKGRLDAKASTATGYCWIVWKSGLGDRTQVVWIPPCRKALERPEDYGIVPPAGRVRQAAEPELDLFGGTLNGAVTTNGRRGRKNTCVVK
jgi:hypothetical protein